MNITTLTVGSLNVGQAAFDAPPALASATIDATGELLTLVFTESVTGTGTGFTLNSGTLGSLSGSGTTWTCSITPVVYEGQTRTLSGTAVDFEDSAAQAVVDFAGFPVTNNSEEVPSEPEGGGDFPLTAVSGTPAYTTGYDGQALSLNGSGGSLVALDIDDFADADTWKVSFRMKTTQTDYSYVSMLAGRFSVELSPTGPLAGKLRVSHSGDTSRGVSSSSTVNDNSWHLVEFQWGPGGTGMICELWVDGASQGTDDDTSTSPSAASAFILGEYFSGGILRYLGLIDDVRILKNGTTYAYWKLDGNGDAEVGGDPIIYSDAESIAEENQPFRGYQILATGTITSYGATGLPDGLSVNAGTGAITGTPTEFGEFEIPISATSASGTGNATLTLTVFEEKGWVYDNLLLAATGAGVDMVDTATSTRTSFWASGEAIPEFVPRGVGGVPAGYAFTRQHVVQIGHLHAVTMTFIIDGVACERTVTSYIEPSPDVVVGVLDSPLPAFAKPPRIISTATIADLEGREVPLVAFNGGELATIHGANFHAFGRVAAGFITSHPHRIEFRRESMPQPGESGTAFGLLWRKDGVAEFIPFGNNGGSGLNVYTHTAAELQEWADTVGNPNGYTVQEFAYP